MNLFDRETALDRLGGDEELLTEISALFLQECPVMMERLRAAVVAGDAHAVMETAHSMKGSLATLGAEEGVLLAMDLEMMGRNRALAGSREPLARLEELLIALKEELAATIDLRNQAA
jgi:HPt (histidine-containing phosphotransfer) domain-containing protein